jgi:hypothetical protein
MWARQNCGTFHFITGENKRVNCREKLQHELLLQVAYHHPRKETQKILSRNSWIIQRSPGVLFNSLTRFSVIESRNGSPQEAEENSCAWLDTRGEKWNRIACVHFITQPLEFDENWNKSTTAVLFPQALRRTNTQAQYTESGFFSAHMCSGAKLDFSLGGDQIKKQRGACLHLGYVQETAGWPWSLMHTHTHKLTKGSTLKGCSSVAAGEQAAAQLLSHRRSLIIALAKLRRANAPHLTPQPAASLQFDRLPLILHPPTKLTATA